MEDNSKTSFISIIFVELSEIPFYELEELKHKVGSKRYNFPTIYKQCNYCLRGVHVLPTSKTMSIGSKF